MHYPSRRRRFAASLRGARPRAARLSRSVLLGALVFAAAAHAQSGPAGAAKAYRIASGPLTVVLPTFIAQSGIVLAGSADLARNRTSPGLNGSYTTADGLAALLSGTGLRATRNAQGAYVLEAEPAPPPAAGTAVLPTVQVTGQAQTAKGPLDGYLATRSFGTKTDLPLVKIPQSINVITADQMRDQGAQSVSQALRYTPGVLSETFGASSQFDLYTQVRGFRPAFFLDGTRLPLGGVTTGWASSVIEPWGLERIEVLKGPSSALYGQSGPGGLINMVSKRPTADTLRDVELQTGSFDRRQMAIDLGGPADEDGKFLYRLTGMVREAGTQVDFIDNNRSYIAPSFTWNLSPDTKFTVLASYQSEWGGKTGFNYLPTSGTLKWNPNGRIPLHRYTGEPDFDHMSRDQGSVGYELEHRFNDTFTFRQNLRYNDTSVDLKALNRVGELQADNMTLNRAALGIDTGVHEFTLDNQLESRFNTGQFGHVMVAGFDYRKENSHYIVGRGPAPPINVYHPVYGLDIADPPYDNFVSQFGNDRQLGMYVQDTISLGGWSLMLSGRHDWTDQSVDNKLTNKTTDQSDEATTGRVGLSYEFKNGIAPYVSYSNSFEPTTHQRRQRVGHPVQADQGRAVRGRHQVPAAQHRQPVHRVRLPDPAAQRPDPRPRPAARLPRLQRADGPGAGARPGAGSPHGVDARVDGAGIVYLSGRRGHAEQSSGGSRQQAGGHAVAPGVVVVRLHLAGRAAARPWTGRGRALRGQYLGHDQCHEDTGLRADRPEPALRPGPRQHGAARRARFIGRDEPGRQVLPDAVHDRAGVHGRRGPDGAGHVRLSLVALR